MSGDFDSASRIMSLELRCRLGLPSQKCLSLLDPISPPPFPFVPSDVLIRILCLPRMISCRVRLARFEAEGNVCGGCGLIKAHRYMRPNQITHSQ